MILARGSYDVKINAYVFKENTCEYTIETKNLP